MSSDTEIEWRPVFGRQTLFVDGVGQGDFYASGNDGVFRVRLWPRYRVQGGSEQFVLTRERAQEVLLEMWRWRREDEAR